MTPYTYARFPPENTSYTVWLYQRYRFNLSRQNVRDYLEELIIMVSREGICLRRIKFGCVFAPNLDNVAIRGYPLIEVKQSGNAKGAGDADGQ